MARELMSQAKRTQRGTDARYPCPIKGLRANLTGADFEPSGLRPTRT